jgi:hypothetical protein
VRTAIERSLQLSAAITTALAGSPQRREVASEAVTQAWGASRPSTLRRTSRQTSRQTSRSLSYTRHLLHCTEVS